MENKKKIKYIDTYEMACDGTREATCRDFTSDVKYR